MENSDSYITGKGIFGGPGGTYGRYGKAVTSNLSTQFANAENVEEMQRRRFKRRREPGYSGAGFWFANYPYMTGAMGNPAPETEKDHDQPMSGASDTAAAADGMGVGGTAAGFVGGLD
jgi:hypothetical protein